MCWVRHAVSNFRFYRGIEFPREWKKNFVTDQCKTDIIASVGITNEQSTTCLQRGVSLLTAQSLKCAEIVMLSFTVTLAKYWKKSRRASPSSCKRIIILYEKKDRNLEHWLYFFRDLWHKTSPYLQRYIIKQYSRMVIDVFVRKGLYLVYTSISELATNLKIFGITLGLLAWFKTPWDYGLIWVMWVRFIFHKGWEREVFSESLILFLSSHWKLGNSK